VLHVRLTELHAAQQNLPFPPNRTLPLKQCQYQGRFAISASVCKISSKSLELRLRYGVFGFFKMAAAAILYFRNLQFLTSVMIKSVELYHRAKCRRNRYNRGRDIAIFRFLKMAAAAILDFKNFKFLTVGTVKKVELHQHAKFHRNSSNPGRDMVFLDFSKWRPLPSWIFEISNF